VDCSVILGSGLQNGPICALAWSAVTMIAYADDRAIKARLGRNVRRLISPN
jgi:hypothetical protein